MDAFFLAHKKVLHRNGNGLPVAVEESGRQLDGESGETRWPVEVANQSFGRFIA